MPLISMPLVRIAIHHNANHQNATHHNVTHQNASQHIDTQEEDTALNDIRQNDRILVTLYFSVSFRRMLFYQKSGRRKEGRVADWTGLTNKSENMKRDKNGQKKIKNLLLEKKCFSAKKNGNEPGLLLMTAQSDWRATHNPEFKC
jgi:hypothetical protein